MNETGFAFLIPLLTFLGEQLVSGAAVVGLSLALSPDTDMSEDEQKARATAELDPLTMATLYNRAIVAAAQAYAATRNDATKVSALTSAHSRLNAYLKSATSLAQAQGAVLAFEQFAQKQATGAAAPAVATASLAPSSSSTSAGMSTTTKLAIGAGIGLFALLMLRGRR